MRFDVTDPAESSQREEFNRLMSGELPEGWHDVLVKYKREALSRDVLPSGVTPPARAGRAGHWLRGGVAVSGRPR